MSALGTDGIHPYDRPLWDAYRFDRTGIFPTMFNDPATLREYTDRWRTEGVWFAVVQVRERGFDLMAKRLRDMERPEVLGYALDRASLTPIRTTIDTSATGDHGFDPIGDGMYRMIPSGDIVDGSERDKRMKPIRDRLIAAGRLRG